MSIENAGSISDRLQLRLKIQRMEALSHGTVSAEIFTGVQGKRGTASGDGGSHCRASARHRSQPQHSASLATRAPRSSWQCFSWEWKSPLAEGALRNWSAR